MQSPPPKLEGEHHLLTEEVKLSPAVVGERCHVHTTFGWLQKFRKKNINCVTPEPHRKPNRTGYKRQQKILEVNSRPTQTKGILKNHGMNLEGGVRKNV